MKLFIAALLACCLAVVPSISTAQLLLTGVGAPSGGGGGGTNCTTPCELGPPVNSSSTTSASFTSNKSCPAGSVLVVYGGTTSEAPTYSNSQGVTFTIGTQTVAVDNYRTTMRWAVLGSTWPVGGTITTTTGSNRAHRLAVACLNGIAIDGGGAVTSGTSTAPSITTAALTGQPAYVVAGLQSNSGMTGGVTAPSGYTQLAAVVATSGPAIFYRRLATATGLTETVSPTPHANVAWAMTYVAMSAP